MPKSTNSSTHENSNPTSRSTSPKPKTKATVSSSLSTHPRPEQGQNKVALLQDAAIQNAFLSERTAADFMSSYGKHPGFVARVHEIGLAIDELAVARANHILRRKEMVAHLRELGRSLPDGPYLRDISRKIGKIDPLSDNDIKEIRPQVPNRHLPNTERPERDTTHTSTTPTPRLPQSEVMVAKHTNLPSQSTPTTDRRTTTTQQPSAKPSGHRYNKCRICNGMGHLQTRCPAYTCVHCKTTSPGHFAKFCARNPYQGIDRRDIPSGALAVLESMEKSMENHFSTSIHRTTTTTPGTNTRSNLQPNVTSVPTSTYTRAKLSVDNVDTHAINTATPTRVTIIAGGPTYKPVLTPRKSNTPTTKDFGKLRQLPTTSSTPLSGGKTPNHSKPSKRPSQQRARTPDYYEGDYEDNYSDVAWYNINGEGNFD